MSNGTDPAALLGIGQQSAGGREYWRSLEELAGTEAFKNLIDNHLPRHAAAFTSTIDRREFLKLMGASLALAGISGCLSPAPAPPDEKIVPYVHQPEALVPGKPLYFASAIPIEGYGRGVLVESHMGRPTKVEGNPQHPASLGATDAVTQASVLGLYAGDQQRRSGGDVGCVLFGAQCGARIAASYSRRGTADTDGNGDLADTGGTASRNSAHFSES